MRSLAIARPGAALTASRYASSARSGSPVASRQRPSSRYVCPRIASGTLPRTSSSVAIALAGWPETMSRRASSR